MNNQSDESSTDRLDDALQREIDQALGEKSIEELFDETLLPMPPAGAIDGEGEVAPGQVRRGLVIDVDGQGVLVELGGKDQGIVPLEQFEEEPSVGDELELAVARYNRNDDLWVLSRQGAVERASWDNIQEGQIVEALVEKTNKGGLEVKFSSIDAFMPISQISLYRVEDTEEFIGQKLRCQVTEVDLRDKRVIVSARAVLEIEAARKREQLLAELKEGDIRDGVVRQVMPYGAFVDLGGVDGLVHVSQMSHAHVK
ncbi:MAG: S1 RNA-binding domain-containing protein, partial [Phycisphaerae bacterium]|nr:S1 RNA-binding domain-containing protein [Phycisphaerae bacterium]